MNGRVVPYSSHPAAFRQEKRRLCEGVGVGGRRADRRRLRASQGPLLPPCPNIWSAIGKCARALCCCCSVGGVQSPMPQKHRILAFMLFAVVAYCLILHHQQHPSVSSFNLIIAALGNRSRALISLRGNSSHHKAGEEGGDFLSLFGGSGADLENWEAELEEELGRRRARVWEVCKANGLVAEDGTGAGDPNAWEFFIDERHRLVWCNIFKAASSSWMYNFNLLGGYKEQFLRKSRKPPLSLARARFPRPTVEQLKRVLPRSLSFIIVRDPFERILSAYRNKIEGFRHKFYRKMAREMIAKFRVRTTLAPGSTSKSSGVEKSPTFSEFVSWVIASAKRATGTKDGGYNGIPGFDEHWAPYFRFCTPCAVNFTVIAKTETLAQDEAYIIHKSGIGPALGRRQGRGGSRPREVVNAAIGGRTEDLLPRYYQTLNREQLDALYEIYRIDFQMFGYDASKYYEMVPL